MSLIIKNKKKFTLKYLKKSKKYIFYLFEIYKLMKNNISKKNKVKNRSVIF